MPTVLEVGPETVRLLRGRSGNRPGDATVAAALGGIDDAVALIDERPVDVRNLWRVLIASTLGESRGPVVVLHPSWWPGARLDRVVEAVVATGRRVAVMSRSELIISDRPAATVIEIAAELVAVCGGSSVRVLDCGDSETVADVAAELAGTPEVLLDIGVAGDAQSAEEIRHALWRRGVVTGEVDVAAVAASAFTARWRPLRTVKAFVVASAVLLALAGGVVVAGRIAAGRAKDIAPAADAQAGSLVEGRIAVAIPSGWIVERVTGGPGSRRVQVRSPADADLALHITQSYAPETTLAQAAEVLGRALADQAPGVFLDFSPADQVAGRPAVTYREVRVGRVIGWSVVLAGSTRISIGCQSAPGREDGIRADCERAVRSAHEVGTAAPG
ncbi:MAG: type VII secretion-associated protein [Mycobacteriaceae bacterium]